MIRTAMILAAGQGKRLRPLTERTPKPLIELAGKPLIVYHLEKLAQAGVQQVVINTAWLGAQFPEILGNGERFGLRIHYSPEPEGGLETAGGIINALPLLGEEPFLLINGDVYSDMDYATMLKNFSSLADNDLAHLWLVPTPNFKEIGDFGLQQKRVLEYGEWTFSGVSILHPKLFLSRPVEFVALAPILREAMTNNQVSGEVFCGFWSDIGTPQRLAEVQNLLSDRDV